MKVTVFMPVYNSSQYLKKTIDSILKQSFSDFEFLIIDDGSTDDSVEIIKSYNDKRIRLIENGVNKGIPYTRNLGLKLAKGKYIAIMDSDDIAHRDRLKIQAEYLDRREDVDIVTSSYYYMYNNIKYKRNKCIDKDEYIKAALLFECYLCNPATMIRTSIRKKVTYREEYFVCQDYGFWVDAIKESKFGAVEKALLSYRKGHWNITKKSSEEKAKERNLILLKIRSDAFKNNKFDISKEDLSSLNKFLDYNNKDSNKIVDVLPVLKKLVVQNSKNKRFDENMFKDIVVGLCETQLYKVDTKIKEKIKLKSIIYCEIGGYKISTINIIRNYVYRIIKKIIRV